MTEVHCISTAQGGKMTPELIARETVYAGYLTVERLKLRLANGTEVWREVERHGNSVAVLPYDPNRGCALVTQQFRAPVCAVGERDLIEACAGMVGDEDVETAARREAYEELGVVLKRLEFIARIWPSPGVSTERQSLFLVAYTDSDRTGTGGGLPEEHEEIMVCEQPLKELARRTDCAHITDAKLLILILALRLRRPDLFA
jgi:nudix-type nucleoside diphosphatase (YffH/AdpP family)